MIQVLKTNWKGVERFMARCFELVDGLWCSGILPSSQMSSAIQ